MLDIAKIFAKYCKTDSIFSDFSQKYTFSEYFSPTNCEIFAGLRSKTLNFSDFQLQLATFDEFLRLTVHFRDRRSILGPIMQIFDFLK